MSAPRQLTLDWPHPPSFAAEDFLPSPSNRDALAAIDRWPDWASRMLILVGPEGSGKSHLAALWAQKSAASVVFGDRLGEADITASAERPAILIEDADRIGEREDRLFHIVNAALQSDRFMLMTGRARARRLEPQHP